MTPYHHLHLSSSYCLFPSLTHPSDSEVLQEMLSLIYHQYLPEICSSSIALAFSPGLKLVSTSLLPSSPLDALPSYTELLNLIALPSRGSLEIADTDRVWSSSFLEFVLSQGPSSSHFDSDLPSSLLAPSPCPFRSLSSITSL